MIHPRYLPFSQHHLVKDEEEAKQEPTEGEETMQASPHAEENNKEEAKPERTDFPEDSRNSYFSTTSPLVTLHTFELSPCGRTVIVGGRIAGGMGVIIWKEWPLIPDSPAHTLMSGHMIEHIEFSSKGDYLGVISVPESRRIDTDADSDDPEMVLSLWRWPIDGEPRETEETDTNEGVMMIEDMDEYDTENTGHLGALRTPTQLLVTTLPQLKPYQINRMSLSRGIPNGIVAAMIAAEDELCVWQVIDGPLGLRVQSSTIGFGLLESDSVLSMYCLATDAYALGVGGGWVVVGVDGEVRARLGGGGCRPCHQGPVTDLMLHGSHLYTVGGDGWLRVWEAETLEEAAVKVGGMEPSTKGWSEVGVSKAWLQLLREVVVHKGPGVPVTLLPVVTSQQLAWVVQTNTGVIYSVWEGEWTSRNLHQGPSGRVTGVAMAHNRPLLAITTNHRYLLVTPLPQSETEGFDGEEIRKIRVPTSIAQAEVSGSPRCVTWAICQVSEDDNLLVVGLEDGAINLYLLHTAPKTNNTQLTLVQTERPHESPIIHISASNTFEPESNGMMSVVVTASEDCRIFVFCLVKSGKVTKLEPVGFHQLETMAQRVEVKGTVIVVEMNDGMVLEIPIPSASPSTYDPPTVPSPSGEAISIRATPNSWFLQCHPRRREVLEGSTVVRKQLLEEAAEAYCAEEPHIFVLTIPSFDGKTMLGVTALGRVVHLHQSRESYSIRLSRRSSISLQRSPASPGSWKYKTQLDMSSDSSRRDGYVDSPDLRLDNLTPSPGKQPRKFSSQHNFEQRTPSVADEDTVVGCVNKEGSWVSAWVEGADLFLYRAKGTSFPTPYQLEHQLRQVAIRGVVIAESGPSLEQRAQKEAKERHKVSMEEKATLLQQKLSKLKWDFKKLSLRSRQ